MNNMQATNKPSTQRSRCMYCGSLNRGKGCRYGPHSVHFHPDDSTKCAYCGSPNYGRGCKINPTNDLHVHGTSYNNMFREFVQSFIDNNLLINELKKPFTSFDAYKKGIINEFGQRIKIPQTIEEKNSYSPIIKTLIKIKRFIGPKADLLHAVQALNETNTSNKLDIKRYNIILHHKDKIRENVNELYTIIEKAKEDGLTLEEIYNLVEM